MTAMETSAAGVMLRIAGGLVTAPEAAVMLLEPTARVATRPTLLIVATDGFEEAQVAVLVRLAVLPSV